jgi:V/A-type H+-transporting ATPase subunit K
MIEVKIMGTKVKLLFALAICLFLFLTGMGVASAQEEVEIGGITDAAWIAIASAITMVGSVLAASWVVAAATRATAEKPEVFGRVLVFVGLAAVIAIWGLLIAFMLWTKIRI